MNFVEGTRFTPGKRGEGSPYTHLLRPKAGGVAFVLDALGGVLRGVLDVTLAYPAGTPSVWDLVFDRIPLVRLHVRELAVPDVRGDYENDPAFRARFQEWINDLWAEKDARLDAMG